MNTAKIQKLSKQCCALQTFRDRCTWADADFSVGSTNCSLDQETSALINTEVRITCDKHIKLLQEIIKAEAIK